MKAGLVKMTGRVTAIKSATDTTQTERIELDLKNTSVDITEVRSIGHRKVAHSQIRKMKSNHPDYWWGEWEVYKFIVTDKSKVLVFSSKTGVMWGQS